MYSGIIWTKAGSISFFRTHYSSLQLAEAMRTCFLKTITVKYEINLRILRGVVNVCFENT